jgi:hypothetical protein
MLVASERVADQHRVAALGVERPVGLIGDLQRAEIDAGVKPQRFAHRKAYDRRMRRVRFARAVGEIERCAGLGHESFPERCLPAARHSRCSGKWP